MINCINTQGDDERLLDFQKETIPLMIIAGEEIASD